MLDKIIGIAAIVVLVAFLGTLIPFVPDIDLLAVIVVVLIMTGYDFYLMLFKNRDQGTGR